MDIDKKEMRICKNKTVKLCFMLKKINNNTLSIRKLARRLLVIMTYA